MRKLILTILFFALIGSADAQTTNYQVHSLFILNIARYSTWPSAATEFHIVVFGKSKLYEELIKQAAGKNINGLPIKIEQANALEEIHSAHIVFLADGKSAALDEVKKATEGKPVMVIAEREGLYKKGAGFSFVLMDNNTLRYDINHHELEKRNIKVSKNVANLANTVI